VDFGKALGATNAATVQKISVYLPDKDRRGELVAQVDEWVEATLTEMIAACGGATLVAPADGAWKSPDGPILRESTRIIYSFIREPDVFVAHLDRIVTILHSFGKYTNQGEVMIELSSESWLDEEGTERKQGYLSRAYYIDRYAKALPNNPLTGHR
jgi:hypothetical protein